MGVGARIRDARRRAGLSLAELAGASSLSKGFLSQVEREISTPSLASLKRIAAALHLSPHLFLTSPVMQEAPATLQADLTSPGNLPERLQSRDVHLDVLFSSPAFKAANITMNGSEQLSGGAATAEHGSLGLCLVTSGAMVLASGGRTITLRSGELVQFNVFAEYQLTCRSARVQALLVFPAEAAMPRFGGVETIVYTAPAVANSYSGPFKLVAMRADRSRAVRAG
jgi:transcriptional regulator with XRE-family HTH domain